jgi:hypothetical protein
MVRKIFTMNWRGSCSTICKIVKDGDTIKMVWKSPFEEVLSSHISMKHGDQRFFDSDTNLEVSLQDFLLKICASVSVHENYED